MSIEYIISMITNNWPMFLRGAGMTLLISIIGTIFGAVIGLLAGVIRTIPKPERKIKRILLKVVNLILSAYIEFLEGLR